MQVHDHCGYCISTPLLRKSALIICASLSSDKCSMYNSVTSVIYLTHKVQEMKTADSANSVILMGGSS